MVLSDTVCDLPGEVTTLFKKIVQCELHWRRDGKIGVADELEPLQSGGKRGRGSRQHHPSPV